MWDLQWWWWLNYEFHFWRGLCQHVWMKETCEIIHVSLENQLPKQSMQWHFALCHRSSYVHFHLLISEFNLHSYGCFYGLMGCVHIQLRSPTTHKWGNLSLIWRVMKNIAFNKQNMGMTNQVVNHILAIGPKHEKK